MASQLTFINHNLRLEYADLFKKKESEKVDENEQEAEQNEEDSSDYGEDDDLFVDFD